MKKKPSKKVYLKLTAKQIELLEPILELVDKASRAGKPGMLLAQITVFNNGEGLAACGFVNHADALKLQEAISPEAVGRTSELVNWGEIWAGIS